LPSFLVTFQITSFPERDLKQEAAISLDRKSINIQWFI